MPSNWIPKPPPTKKSQAQRLACRAYPTTGTVTGAPPEWCQANQGEWCGKCPHRSHQ